MKEANILYTAMHVEHQHPLVQVEWWAGLPPFQVWQHFAPFHSHFPNDLSPNSTNSVVLNGRFGTVQIIFKWSIQQMLLLQDEQASFHRASRLMEPQLTPTKQKPSSTFKRTDRRREDTDIALPSLTSYIDKDRT